ncbi:hypothetical protein AVEN_113399-1, partial [Araneus ventricosus]
DVEKRVALSGIIDFSSPFIYACLIDCYFEWEYLEHSSISSANGDIEKVIVYWESSICCQGRGPGLADACHSMLTPVKLSSHL